MCTFAIEHNVGEHGERHPVVDTFGFRDDALRAFESVDQFPRRFLRVVERVLPHECASVVKELFGSLWCHDAAPFAAGLGAAATAMASSTGIDLSAVTMTR